MAAHGVLLEERPLPGVVVLTMNRPDQLNALNEELTTALARAFEKLGADEDIRAVVLTGAGKAFCAGVDLNDPLDGVEQSSDSDEALRNNPVFHMSRVPVPVIAAVNGHCITGGFELALACDILVGSSAASFRDTHVKFGLAPCWGLSQKLPRLIGATRAALVSYTAGKIDAKIASDWGLLARVTAPEHLMEEAVKIAGTIAQNDASMVRKYKKVLAAGLRLSLGEGLSQERLAAKQHYAGMQDQLFGTGWKSKL